MPQGHPGNGSKGQGSRGGFGGFLRRRAAVALLVVAPLLLTGDGEMVFLNAVGIGIGLMALRRFMPRPRVGKLRC